VRSGPDFTVNLTILIVLNCQFQKWEMDACSDWNGRVALAFMFDEF
jgi:hypothetical protein